MSIIRKIKTCFAVRYLYYAIRYRIFISRSKNYCTVKYKGLKFCGGNLDDILGHVKVIFIDKIYTKHHEIHAFEVVLDIGAHVGIFSILAASKLAFVIAVEPHPENYKWLCDNKRDKFLGNIHAFQCAASDNCYQETLSIGHNTVSHSTVAENKHESIVVDAMTIDEIVYQSYVSRVDFIKMNCEGAELKALHGAIGTMERFSPDIVISTGHYADEIYQLGTFLEAHGYSVDVEGKVIYATK